MGLVGFIILGLFLFLESPPETEDLVFECNNDSECLSSFKCCDGICKRKDRNGDCPHPPPRPDLLGESLYVSVNCFQLGEPVTVTARIGNYDSIENVTQPFTVSFLISGNAIFGDGDDLLLGTFRHTEPVPALYGGVGLGPTFTVTMETENLYQNSYFEDTVNYIGMKVDSRGEIVEQNEDNNGPLRDPVICRRDCVKIFNPFLFPADAATIEGPIINNPQPFTTLSFIWRTNFSAQWPFSCKPIRIDYQTEDATAIAGVDYTPRSGRMLCSSVNCMLGVKITPDNLEESDEYFKLYFTIQNASLVNPRSLYEDYHRDRFMVKGHILNDD